MVEDEVKESAQEEGEEGEKEGKEKGKKKFSLKLPKLKLGKFKIPILIVIVVGLAVGTSFGVMKYLGKRSAVKNEKKEEVKIDVGSIVSLEPFTVNLVKSNSYLQIEVSLELEKDNESLNEEVESRKAQIRDTIITILRSKAPNQVSSAEGEQQLKEEIKNEVDSLLTCGKIKSVYFTTFIMQ